MPLSIKFETANAAFEREPRSAVASVLRDIAFRIETEGADGGPVWDHNGNKIGSFYVELEDE